MGAFLDKQTLGLTFSLPSQSHLGKSDFGRSGASGQSRHLILAHQASEERVSVRASSPVQTT